MHNDLADGKLCPDKITTYWNWLSEKIKQFKVQVVMGDFNMSLFSADQ